jgi:hypothetical protein
MTDHDLEQRLRAWYRAEMDDGESAPLQLRTDLETLAQTTARSRRRLKFGWRSTDMNRFARFGLAATAIAVALLVSIGLLLRPSLDIGPSPSPNPTHGATPEASATPAPTAHPAAWTTTGSMIEARAGHTATLLSDGTVLVAGGGFIKDASVITELYDPGTGIWTTTPENLHVNRANPTATLLRDGRVLVVGGVYSAPPVKFGPDFGAELYDPVSGTWQYTGSTSRRIGHTATLLSDGRVLVAGGFDGGSSAELYDPVSWTTSARGNIV